MRNIHQILLMVFIYACSGGPSFVEEKDLVERDGLMYLEGSDVPYTGKAVGIYQGVNTVPDLPSVDSRTNKKVPRWSFECDYENGKIKEQYYYLDKKNNKITTGYQTYVYMVLPHLSMDARQNGQEGIRECGGPNGELIELDGILISDFQQEFIGIEPSNGLVISGLTEFEKAIVGAPFAPFTGLVTLDENSDYDIDDDGDEYHVYVCKEGILQLPDGHPKYDHLNSGYTTKKAARYGVKFEDTGRTFKTTYGQTGPLEKWVRDKSNNRFAELKKENPKWSNVEIFDFLRKEIDALK